MIAANFAAVVRCAVIGQAEVGRLGASEMVTTGGGKGEKAQAAVGEGAKGARHGGEGGAEGDDIVDDEQPASRFF